MANTIDAIIIGGASAALGVIVASKFFNTGNQGGGQPKQAKQSSYTARHGQVSTKTPDRLPVGYAPVAQNTPITEAAYNIQPTSYDTTLGPDQNTASSPVTLPI